MRCRAIAATASQVVATWEAVIKDEVADLNRAGCLRLMPCKLCGAALPTHLQVRDEALAVEPACPDSGFRETGKTGIHNGITATVRKATARYGDL